MGITAARITSPGAAMSGLSDAYGLGPRELKPDMRSPGRDAAETGKPIVARAPLPFAAGVCALIAVQFDDSIEYDAPLAPRLMYSGSTKIAAIAPAVTAFARRVMLPQL